MSRNTNAGQAGGLSLGVIVAVVLLAGLAAAVPVFLLGRGAAENAETTIDALDAAKDAQAQSALTNGIRAAQVHFAEQGTFEGFTASTAAAYDPTVGYNDGGAAPGRVSIRGATPTSVVLVYPKESGASLCAAANGTAITYGRQNASTAADCSGGW